MILVAWSAKATIAAFYAAIRGGRLFADGFFGLLVEQVCHNGALQFRACAGVLHAATATEDAGACARVWQAQKGVTVCPGIVGANFDPNESVLDEIVGYIIAAQGLMFQLTQDFALPFPWNMLLSPLTLVEWLIRTQLGDLADPDIGTHAPHPHRD